MIPYASGQARERPRNAFPFNFRASRGARRVYPGYFPGLQRDVRRHRSCLYLVCVVGVL